MSLEQTVESRTYCPYLHAALWQLYYPRLSWIYNPVSGTATENEQTGRLASRNGMTFCLLLLGRAKVLRGLRNFLETGKPYLLILERKGSSRWFRERE